jgi:hypothetical protein
VLAFPHGKVIYSFAKGMEVKQISFRQNQCLSHTYPVRQVLDSNGGTRELEDQSFPGKKDYYSFGTITQYYYYYY